MRVESQPDWRRIGWWAGVCQKPDCVRRSRNRSQSGQCGKNGYRGRIGIQDVFAVTAQMREAIGANMSEGDLQSLNTRSGLRNIFTDGVAKAVMGLTTLEEVYKNVVVDG